ncbi:fungal-specific transcription factor domain-containing protein [Dactylonectria macrodidyma]|uniref:Fungal-specific transcription factor domain-containing protein n=1 Tax=Dactylonectria macrodidyma TaxID=307937 RepID=A0A9P9E7D8_9HYPO|nr:fungal-specific transcription factor domain-containing protein [Dactylonectria macrodidyma]
MATSLDDPTASDDVLAYCHLSSSAKPTVNSLTGKVSSLESLTMDAPPHELGGPSPMRIITPGLFVRKDAVDTNYIGLNSIGATVALCLKDALDSQHVPLTADSLRFLIEAGPHLDEIGVPFRTDLLSLELPPQSMYTQSIDAYFNSLHTSYPIVDETMMRARAEAMYGPDRPQLQSHEYAEFFLVVSIGYLCDYPGGSNSAGTGQARQLIDNTYSQAWLLMNESISAPSEAAIQVLLLHAMYQMCFGKCGIAWVLCGFALQVAQSIGLHRQSPRDMDLTEAKTLFQTQLWWTLYALDASLSMSQGRPPAISNATTDKDIHHTTEESHAAPPTKSQIRLWNLQLAQLQNRFCHCMHRMDTLPSRMETLGELDAELVRLRDSIPSDCRPEHEILVPAERFSNILLLHLEYHNLVRSIHWASIALTSTTNGGVAKLTMRMRASEAICLAAARSFIGTLNHVVVPAS